MDIAVKIERFQIKQNVLNLKSTLKDDFHYIMSSKDCQKIAIFNDVVYGRPRPHNHEVEFSTVFILKN